MPSNGNNKPLQLAPCGKMRPTDMHIDDAFRNKCTKRGQLSDQDLDEDVPVFGVS